MGSKAKTDDVGIFVAEKWVDSVVSVERHSERALVLKMVLGDCLLNVLTAYAPHSGKPDEEKERFWNKMFRLVSCIRQNEMVVFAGDTNGHIGSGNVGPCRHKETWWWNEDVAEAVRNKKIKYGKWKRENTKEAWKSIRTVDKMQRGLFLQQRKRNRRNVQMT